MTTRVSPTALRVRPRIWNGPADTTCPLDRRHPVWFERTVSPAPVAA
ncbi:hypothetical protein [Microbacterium sp. H1-D42]|nr:hypothetical protein [Microbacterium sp. H1-D42]UNK71488.1 hypothetical protein MNR00_03260 [Microbacterium sp. H1-D42]